MQDYRIKICNIAVLVDLVLRPLSSPLGITGYQGEKSERLYNLAKDIAEYLDVCKVQWSLEGVTLREPSGHTLLIPRDSFIGGR